MYVYVCVCQHGIYHTSHLPHEVNPIINHPLQVGFVLLGIAGRFRWYEDGCRCSQSGGDATAKTKKAPLKKNEGIKVP